MLACAWRSLETQRRDQLQVLEFQQRSVLGILSVANSESKQRMVKALQRLEQRYLDLTYPWTRSKEDQKDEVSASQSEMEAMYAAYVAEYGDPKSPEVRERVARAISDTPTPKKTGSGEVRRKRRRSRTPLQQEKS